MQDDLCEPEAIDLRVSAHCYGAASQQVPRQGQRGHHRRVSCAMRSARRERLNETLIAQDGFIAELSEQASHRAVPATGVDLAEKKDGTRRHELLLRRVRASDGAMPSRATTVAEHSYRGNAIVRPDGCWWLLWRKSTS